MLERAKASTISKSEICSTCQNLTGRQRVYTQMESQFSPEIQVFPPVHLWTPDEHQVWPGRWSHNWGSKLLSAD